MNFMQNKARLLKYSELTKYNSLDTLFGKHDVVFILFETQMNYGHWVVLCRDRKNKKIYFFDSYGTFPDEQLKFTDDVFRVQNNMVLPHLTALLYKYDRKGWEIHYNDHQLQELGNDIATCGRWVAVFATLFKDLTIDEFADLFLNEEKSPDELITELTYFIAPN